MAPSPWPPTLQPCWRSSGLSPAPVATGTQQTLGCKRCKAFNSERRWRAQGAGPPTGSEPGGRCGCSPSPQRCWHQPPRAGSFARFPFIAENTAPARAGRKKPHSPPHPPPTPPKRGKSLCTRRIALGWGETSAARPPGAAWTARSSGEQPRAVPCTAPSSPPAGSWGGGHSHWGDGGAAPLPPRTEGLRWDGPVSSPQRGLLLQPLFLLELGPKCRSLGVPAEPSAPARGEGGPSGGQGRGLAHNSPWVQGSVEAEPWWEKELSSTVSTGWPLPGVTARVRARLSRGRSSRRAEECPARAGPAAQGLPESSPTRWRRWKTNSNMVAARLWWIRYRGRRPCGETTSTEPGIRAAPRHRLAQGWHPIPSRCRQPEPRDAQAPQRGAAAFQELAPGEELKNVLISLKKPCTTQPQPPQPALYYVRCIKNPALASAGEGSRGSAGSSAGPGAERGSWAQAARAGRAGRRSWGVRDPPQGWGCFSREEAGTSPRSRFSLWQESVAAPIQGPFQTSSGAKLHHGHSRSRDSRPLAQEGMSHVL